MNAAVELESFDGLTLPPYMSMLELTDVDLGRLTPFGVKTIDYLSLEDTGLRDLTAFADLESANAISIESFTMPAGWANADVVMIQNNANLTRVDFTGQSYIDYLSIMNNPQLEQANLGGLDKVNLLEVVGNPHLPFSTFGGIRRFDTTPPATPTRPELGGARARRRRARSTLPENGVCRPFGPEGVAAAERHIPGGAPPN